MFYFPSNKDTGQGEPMENQSGTEDSSATENKR